MLEGTGVGFEGAGEEVQSFPDETLLNCGLRGGMQGAELGSGVQRFWGA